MGKAVAKSGIGFYLFLLKLAPLGKELQWLFRKHSNCAFFFFLGKAATWALHTHLQNIVWVEAHKQASVGHAVLHFYKLQPYIFTNCNPHG